MRLLCLISCIILSSCANRAPKDDENNKFVLDKNLEWVHTIPDSLRTPEQQELLELMAKTVYQYTQVKDNHLVFTLAEDEFVKLGIPKHYYDLHIHELKNVNKFVDSQKIENLDSMWNAGLKQFYMKFDVKE